MKSQIQSLAKLSFIAVSLFFISCGGDDDNTYYPPVANTPSNASYITGKVDGNNFSTIIFGTSTATCNRIGTGDMQMITILGGDMSANSITVNLVNVHSTGVINVNRNTESFLNFSPGSGGVAYATSAECDTATGTINITYIDDTKVEGTFSFTGVDTEDCAGGTKTVTEGAFRGTFPQ
jgi:hypothetical protein